MSMRTDRQGKILSLGPVIVTGTVAKKMAYELSAKAGI